MKTAIIFLCFLGVGVCWCDAIVTTGTPNQTDNVTSSNLTTDSTATSDLQTSRPTVTPHTTPAYDKPSLSTTSEFNRLFLIAGGLILACAILLISTILLAWKVCQLSRRLKMLSGRSDLMIPAKFCMGNNKSDADAKETTVLMSNLNETRDEDGEGGNEPETKSKKEEKDKCENGVEQKEKDAKDEEMKETPGAAVEESSGPKEEGKESQVDKSKSRPTSGEAKSEGK